MSDSTQGEGWWQASDDKWYPPEQHPDFQAGATQAMEPVPPPTAAMPVPPPPPPGAPVGPPPGGPEGPPPGAPGSGSNNTKWIIVGVLAVAAVAIAAFLLLGGDDDDQKVTASSSSPSASSSSSSKSSSSSSKSSSSSSKSSSSTSSSSSATDADIQKKMLTAQEVGPGFTDETFTPDNTGPTFCGAANLNQQVPPLRNVGSAASSGVAYFQEEASAYSTSADAQKVLDIIKGEATCPGPTIEGGGPIVFSAPTDVTASMTTPVEEAIEIDFQTEEAQGQFFVIKDTVAIVLFQFVAQKGTDISQLPVAIDVVNKGLKKIVTP